MAQMPETIILRKAEETKTGVTYCMADVKTNADRIRAMTDEELAQWIDHIQADAYERGMMETPVVDYPNVYSNWLDWLKSPVEVDNGI